MSRDFLTTGGRRRISHPGSADLDTKAQRLLNAHPVPAGVHHDVASPIPVTAVLLWEHDGEEQIDPEALEWTSSLVRVRIADLRVRVGAVWLPAEDIRRR